MPVFNPVFIRATNLDDAWHQLLFEISRHGRLYRITSGSRAGLTRLAFDYVAGYIDYPHERPLAPKMPEQSHLPPPTTDEEIENYFVNYLMNPNLSPNEHYRYSSWIIGGNPLCELTQMDWIIKHLQVSPGNDHCYLTIGEPDMLMLYDSPYKECPSCNRRFNYKFFTCPYCNRTLIEHEHLRRTTPCLRGLDFRIVDDHLFTHVIYRCVPGDTPILARIDGMISRTTVKRLEVVYRSGDSVIEVLGETGTGSIGWVRVGQITHRLATNILSVKLTGNVQFLLTANHRLPVLRDNSVTLLEAAELRCGDGLLEPKEVDVKLTGVTSIDVSNLLEDDMKLNAQEDKEALPQTIRLNADWGWFFGIWLADGWFSKVGYPRIAVSKQKKEIRDRISQFVGDQFNHTPTVEDRGDCWVLSVDIGALGCVMRRLGFKHNVFAKRVPDVLFLLNYDTLSGVLDGWLASDRSRSASSELIIDMMYIGKLIGRSFCVSELKEKETRCSIESDGALLMQGCLRRDENTFIYNGVEYIVRTVKDITVLVNGAAEVFDIGVVPEPHTFCCGTSPILTHNSWDLISGFPTNMGGFTLLNEYMAQEIGVLPGPLAFSCKSLHVYSDQFDYLASRTGRIEALKEVSGGDQEAEDDSRGV